MPSRTLDLATLDADELPAAAWSLLEDGVDAASSPFHTPTIATLGQHGPAQRSVVLRHVDPAQRLLICHTDRRSAKARELVADGRMSWHFYDRRLKLQLRCHGRGVLHADDAFADACWERCAPRSKICYNTPLGPGRPLPSPPPAPPSIGSDAEASDARSHFAAIACHVEFIDWLYLSGAGHRRAFIELDGRRVAVTWASP